MPKGDSVEALRKIWTEGYERGLREGRRERRPATVEISHEDLRAVYSEPCANPDECPACKANAKRGR